jgi:hypothetical protein
MRTTLLALLVALGSVLPALCCQADTLFTTIDGAYRTFPSHFRLEVINDIGGPSAQWTFPTATVADIGSTLEIGRADVGQQNYQLLNHYLTDGLLQFTVALEPNSAGGFGIGEWTLWQGGTGPFTTVTSHFPAPNGVDWYGYHVSRMTLTLNGPAPGNAHAVTLHLFGDAGQVPEPTSWLLVLLGICAIGVHHCARLQLPPCV